MILIKFIKGVYRMFKPNYTASVSSLFFIIIQSICILLLYQTLHKLSISGKLIKSNMIDLFMINTMYPVTQLLNFLFIIIGISYIIALLISTISRTGKFNAELQSLNDIKNISSILDIINSYVGWSITIIILVFSPIYYIIEPNIHISVSHTMISICLYILLLLHSVLMIQLVISLYILDLKINR